MKEVFVQFDKDKNNSIEKSELKRLLRQLGKSSKQSAIDQLLSNVAPEDRDHITWDTFLALGPKLFDGEPSNYGEVFDEFDTDGDGYLVKEELVQALRNVSQFTDEELGKIFDELDLNHDGKISRPEFEAMGRKLN